MNPAALPAVLETLGRLQSDLSAAQQGPLHPRLRTELARVAAAAERSVSRIAASGQAAKAALETKQQRATQMAAANKQLIAAKQKALAEKKATKDAPVAPSNASAPIDPQRATALSQELLARQTRNAPITPVPDAPSGVLDNWTWPTPSLAAER